MASMLRRIILIYRWRIVSAAIRARDPTYPHRQWLNSLLAFDFFRPGEPLSSHEPYGLARHLNHIYLFNTTIAFGAS
jgi:hypothetical protein